MEYIIFVTAIIGVIIVAKIFSWPVKIIFKLLANISIGVFMMILINLFASPIGLHIPFNTITAIISGVLGIPGIILLCILRYI